MDPIQIHPPGQQRKHAHQIPRRTKQMEEPIIPSPKEGEEESIIDNFEAGYDNLIDLPARYRDCPQRVPRISQSDLLEAAPCPFTYKVVTMSHRMLVLLASFAICLLLWPSHCEAKPLSDGMEAISTGTWSGHHRSASHGFGLSSIPPPRPSSPPRLPPAQHDNVAPLPAVAPPEPTNPPLPPSSEDLDEVPSMPPPPVPEEPQASAISEPKQESPVPDETTSEQKLNETMSTSKSSNRFFRHAYSRISRMMKKPKQKSKSETSAPKPQGQEATSQSESASPQVYPRPRRGALVRFSRKEQKGKDQAQASSSKPHEQMAEMPGPSWRQPQYLPRNVAGTLKRKETRKETDPLFLHPQLRGVGE
ncbi:hypothetical protein L249_0301 [Ophiocordyceps polyrhachis-furcata BCC 54312]|uniref:Uncharacterized protein n=1 Tax=Ophiocordyceps polyrhachis-furcata BCC 54312 TaxID=1330021 RepID=A0A367LGJ6_9HYPO|nr:hypothetical protein L249_0301 [Ophiocordyceps polyrhachis-furcata BCC 54312]